MAFYRDHILPRLVDKMCNTRDMDPLRRASTQDLRGTVLEIGFGSGSNVPFLPAAVERVMAVDPSLTGRKLAARRLQSSKIPVDFIGLDGQSIALDDNSVDAVLCTFSLCTIPDASTALSEAKRVLRPGGRLHFLEHGRHPSSKIARRQDRWNPVQQRLFGGCNVNRAIDDLIGGAGFEIEAIEHPAMKGPAMLSYLYQGVAVG